MKAFPIPVVPFGPGSHPDADEANFLPMPREMDTFSLPACHLEADPQVLSAACGLLTQLRDAMLQTGHDAAIHPGVELAGVATPVLNLLNQSLGHGEVSIMVREPVLFHIQETVFAGIWRIQEIAGDGSLQRDALLAGEMPQVVQRSALAAADGLDPAPPGSGIMNAPAVISELRDRSRSYRPGQPAHVINLTLLPMTPEDLDYLVGVLGVGPVTMLSRGYGNCRITSTKLAHVWWVQYFNSMDQIILNTLEVADVPEVAKAAREDYEDSIERLGEWLAVMKEEHV